MSSKKSVLLSNHEGLQYDPSYGVLWSDTWVMFKLRRKIIRLAPTLISMTSVDRDREIFGSNAEYYGYEEPKLPDYNWDFCMPFPIEDGDDPNVPTIVVNQPWVTKSGTEGAIGWYIRQRFGVTTDFRFRWKNHKRKFFMVPG